MPNKVIISRLTYPNDGQNQQKTQLDLPIALPIIKIIDGNNLITMELSKENTICDGLEVTRNVSHLEPIAGSKSKGGKSGSKGKSTSTLLVPKQEMFFQSKKSKKKKAPSTMVILERNNFGSNLEPKILVEVQVLEYKTFNVSSPKKHQSCIMDVGDGIDQNAKFVGDKGEDEKNEHEKDQEDAQEEEVDEDNGDEKIKYYPNEKSRLEGSFA